MKLPDADQQLNASCVPCGEMHQLYTELLGRKLQTKTGNQQTFSGCSLDRKNQLWLQHDEQFSFTLAYSMRALGHSMGHSA
jgi:hypothetical protein